VKNNKHHQWCWDNFINPKSMQKVMVNMFVNIHSTNLRYFKDVRNQLVEYMINMGTPKDAFTVGGAIPDSEKIRKCFVSGFARNAAQLQPDKKSYFNMLDHKVFFLLFLSDCLFTPTISFIKQKAAICSLHRTGIIIFYFILFCLHWHCRFLQQKNT
jgi:hypothetical protein